MQVGGGRVEAKAADTHAIMMPGRVAHLVKPRCRASSGAAAAVGPGASSALPLRNSHVELDLPLGLARLGPRVSDVSLVSAGEGVAAGLIPAIESDPVVASPLDESLVGAPGVIDVSKRSVSARRQHARPDPVIALELCRRDDTYFEVHRTFHVYDAQAQEERPGRFDVAARQPQVKLSQQLVADSQHPAEWCHHPDA